MGMLSEHNIGGKVPHIPNRKERRRRAKSAGLFKHKGAWQHVNQAAYEQRDKAIHKLIHRANQKHNMEKSDETTKE